MDAPAEVYAEGFDDLRGIAVDADGHVFVADRAAGTVTRIAPGRTRAVLANRLERPLGLTFDASGRLLIAEERAGRVVRVEADGRRTPIVSGIQQPRWLAVGQDGTLYISARRLARDHNPELDDESAKKDMILRLSPAGPLSVFAGGFENLQGLAVGGEALFAATQGRRDDTAIEGVVLRIPILPDGGAGPAIPYGPSDRFEKPRGLALDRLGALYLTTQEVELGDHESKRAIAKLHGAGPVSLFAARLEDPHGLAFDPAGNLFLADGDSGRVLKFRAPPAPGLVVPAVTRQSPLTVHGGTERRARVDLFLNEEAAPVTVLADRVGAFTTTLGLALNAENHLEVYATPYGGLGLSSAPALASVTHDVVAPTLVFQAPPAGGHLRPPVAVRAQAADPGSGVAGLALSLDGQPLGAALSPAPPAARVTASATWGASGVADGVHTLGATAQDAVGNLATASRLVTIDATPPDTTITDGPAGVTSDPSATFTFAGTDNLAPAATLQFAWRLDGGPWSAFAAATTAALSNLAQGPHVFEVKGRDLAGHEDPTPAGRSFTIGGLRVTITEPAAGTRVPAGLLLVRGAVETGGAEVGVTVNSVPAAVQGSAFAVVVPVNAEVTSLTAVATSASGAAAHHSIGISVVGSLDSSVVLRGSPQSGVAPLAVTFSLPSRSDFTAVELDLDGNGTVDFTGPSLEGQIFTYIQPGLYVPTAVLIDTQGSRSKVSTVVHVLDADAVEAVLQTRWSRFKDALRRGDIDAGLQSLAAGIRGRYRPAMEALGPGLPAFGAGLGDLRIVSLLEGLAEAATVRLENGQPAVYFIYFVSDEDGTWRILGM